MAATIPEAIQPLLGDYQALMERDLPGLLMGFYLYGSIALGAFNERLSDIDFISVVSRRCTPDDIQRLTQIHQTIQAKYPRWSFEGSYLQWGDLGQADGALEAYPYSNERGLQPPGHHDVNSITWWLLKNRGIALIGPLPADLPFTVDWDVLIANMRINLNTYWRGFTRKPERIAWLLSDYGVQWAVLGVLRQYYSFETQSITSKDGAGDYALDHLPERWHRLIQEALNIRRQANAPSLYRVKLSRALDAFRFLNYILRVCNGKSP